MIEDGNITGGGVGNVDEHWLRWGDYNWFTPLFGACQSSSLAKVKILLDRCQQSNNSFAKGACHNGMSAIHFALASQHPTAASIVTCLSAHLDHRYLSEYREEKTGYTLLHRAAQEASLSSFRRVLSSFNVPPNVRGSLDGKTALHVAISPEVDRGSTEMTLVVKMLLRYGVDCELRESIYGDTALLHAVRVFADGGAWSSKVEEVSSSVRSGQPHGMLASLLDHGADINAKDHHGWNVLERSFNPYVLIEGYKHDYIPIMLLERGATKYIDGDEEYPDYSFPLLSAVENQSPRLVKCILEHGANPHTIDYNGVNALFGVAFHPNLAVLKILINKRVNPFIRNNRQSHNKMNALDILKKNIETGFDEEDINVKYMMMDYMQEYPVDRFFDICITFANIMPVLLMVEIFSWIACDEMLTILPNIKQWTIGKKIKDSC